MGHEFKSHRSHYWGYHIKAIMLALQASHLSSILSSSTPCFLKILYYNSTYLLFESLEVKETLYLERELSGTQASLEN